MHLSIVNVIKYLCILKIILLRVIPTMTCWVGVVRLWLSSSFIPWTKRKTSNRVEKVRWKRPNISKAARPASFFSGFLHDLVVSCLLLRIAPVRSVQVNRSQPFAKTCQYTTWQKQTCQNMPQQTCQIMSGYHLSKIKIQASNMAAYPLKQSQKL